MGSKWFNEYVNPVLDYNVDLTGSTCTRFFWLLSRSTPNGVAWNNRNESITTEAAPWSSYSPALTQFCWTVVWIPCFHRATLSLKTLKENPSIPYSQLPVWLAILSFLNSYSVTSISASFITWCSPRVLVFLSLLFFLHGHHIVVRPILLKYDLIWIYILIISAKTLLPNKITCWDSGKDMAIGEVIIHPRTPINSYAEIICILPITAPPIVSTDICPLIRLLTKWCGYVPHLQASYNFSPLLFQILYDFLYSFKSSNVLPAL